MNMRSFNFGENVNLGIQESRIIKFQKVITLGGSCRMGVVVKILGAVIGVDDSGDVDDCRRTKTKNSRSS